MRSVLFAAVAASALQAASIRGVVVEHQTGRPLARSLVVAQPIAGTNAGPQSVRTDVNGVFEIGSLPGGAYLVIASRRAFAPAQWGQKQWKGAGTPVVLEENQTSFLQLRLQRYGSISGLIVDENDVGLQEHEVVAYRNTRPPVLAGRAKTDDRGFYRIWGLEPGSYLIRTVGKRYDEGDYLPTFSRETARVDQSRPAEVQLDGETTDVHVRPFPGRLFTLAGRATVYPPARITLTLVSDLGSESVSSDEQGNFKFPPTAPGPYELYAVAQGDRRYGNGRPSAAYQLVSLDRDSDVRVSLGGMPELHLTVEDTKGQAIDPATVQILYRSKNLSGDGKAQTLRAPQGRVALPPGRYDFTLAASPTYCMIAFTAPKSESDVRGRPDGWNELTLPGPGAVEVKFVLSTHPATVRGVARNASHDPVEGVPVFLEAYDPESRRRVGDLRAIRTDTRGQFEFYGLAPGRYRLLSTFEYQSPDTAQIDAARPHDFQITEGKDETVDLDVYVVR